MAYESLTPRSFTNKELAESLQFYIDCTKKGYEPLILDYMEHFHCLYGRAKMLYRSAAWAYKVKVKEKAQADARRKKVC